MLNLTINESRDITEKNQKTYSYYLHKQLRAIYRIFFRIIISVIIRLCFYVVSNISGYLFSLLVQICIFLGILMDNSSHSFYQQNQLLLLMNKYTESPLWALYYHENLYEPNLLFIMLLTLSQILLCFSTIVFTGSEKNMHYKTKALYNFFYIYLLIFGIKIFNGINFFSIYGR